MGLNPENLHHILRLEQERGMLILYGGTGGYQRNTVLLLVFVITFPLLACFEDMMKACAPMVATSDSTKILLGQCGGDDFRALHIFPP